MPFNTVDGCNPAPVDMVNILLFTAFYTSQVVFSPDFWTINSMVGVVRTVQHTALWLREGSATGPNGLEPETDDRRPNSGANTQNKKSTWKNRDN